MTTRTKQPNEQLTFAMDFQYLLAAGDSLSAVSSITDTPTGELTIGSGSISGDTVVFAVSGGTDQTTYHIEVIATTALAETIEGDGYLLVTDTPEIVDGEIERAYRAIKVAVADYLGWGRNTEGVGTAWTDDMEYRLKAIIKAGAGQFYWPPPLAGERTAHSWTFLKPVATLSTVADQEDYDLPSDFGGLIGKVYYSADDDVWHPIQDIGPGAIYKMRSRDQSSGEPKWAAVIPQTSTGTTSQAWTLALAPPPDDAFTLQYRYQVIPDTIRVPYPYHLGNATHSETMLQSCIAIAERRYNDGDTQQQVAFLQTLAASVAHDRRMAPQTLGYNADRSGYTWARKRANLVTYEGTLYDNT